MSASKEAIAKILSEACPVQPRSLKSVKEMFLEELIHLIVIVKRSITLLKVLNPIETCILDLWRETLPYSTTLYISHMCTRNFLLVNILLE